MREDKLKKACYYQCIICFIQIIKNIVEIMNKHKCASAYVDYEY